MALQLVKGLATKVVCLDVGRVKFNGRVAVGNAAFPFSQPRQSKRTIGKERRRLGGKYLDTREREKRRRRRRRSLVYFK